MYKYVYYSWCNLKIPFDAIPSEGLTLNVEGNAWFPEDEFTLRGPLDVQVSLRRSNERVTMGGSITCSCDLVCDRCLTAYTAELKSDFSVFFDLVDSGSAPQPDDEHYLSDQELDVVELDEPVVDVFSTLREQFFLMLPAKLICGEGCKGLCVHCGENLNLGRCACSGRDTETPFSVLAKLKDN